LLGAGTRFPYVALPQDTTLETRLRMIPLWLHALSIGALILGALCALVLLADVLRHPQHMGIMNVVWPITGLYAGPLALWGYFRFGRVSHHGHGDGAYAKPFFAAVGIGATHCGAGCTLGDILAEWLCFGAPAVAVWFGWQSIFPDKIFAVWIVDYIFAFTFGIVFQYFDIAPMRGLGLYDGIVAALKADTLSLSAWQVGMYGFMALAQLAYFRPLLGKPIEVNTTEFWFAMQLAMLCGFLTSYPVNWWLITAGIKEKM
jgi:Domain of unknown function (DUF4396)